MDGGIANQAFLFPANFTRADLDLWTDNARKSTVYVIRNGKVTPEYAAGVGAAFPPCATKSVEHADQDPGHRRPLPDGTTPPRRVGVDFNAIWIPESFSETEPKPFDRDYMRAVYALGRQMAADGIPWSKRPPE